MDMGLIGLGKMGANMARRLLKGGHRLVVGDMAHDAVQRMVEAGARGASTTQDVAAHLSPPRAVWLMVPAGEPTERTIAALIPLLSRGDVIIDGGNSYYRDSIRRAAMLKDKGYHLLDVGASGGVWGLTEGYSLMIGGDADIVQRLRPIFETLAPAPGHGWGRVGPSGAGHFVKMVHNGIEYGLMQAYAEGFALMEAKKVWALDLPAIAEVWRHGSVVRSWLLDLTAAALAGDPALTHVKPWVEDSGEGRWTVIEAMDLEVSAPVITESLIRRVRSREASPFADRLLAMMRQAFGGHAVKKE